jgi:hypothetical protein
VKPADRIALLYGLAVVGSGAVSYWRGKRGPAVLVDAAVHGAVIGTGFNIVAWCVVVPEPEPEPWLARTNTETNTETGMGKLSKEGIRLLSNLNVDQLYADLKENGVKIALVPENASIITQDEV